ncbi:MAG: hypothetical protein EXR58_04130 [Chloroflexi bacterium]|nr:hypothetical protein [Chloroflexota bacterium]
MTSAQPDLESGLSAWLRAHLWLASWVGVGLLAGLLRVGWLDTLPLDSEEARLALAAWHASLGEGLTGMLPTDGRVLPNLMTFIVWLFGASDASSRLVPALAGTATALMPALIQGWLGPRVALATGIILAISPVGIETSREVNPVAVNVGLVLFFAVCAVRMATDRPSWATWGLAGSLGLGVASGPGFVLGLLSLGVALFALGNEVNRLLPQLSQGLRQVAKAPGPALFGIGVGFLTTTGGLMDLGGVGYLLGGVWGAMPGLMKPSAPSVRNALGLTGYVGPLIVVGLAGLGWGIRQRDRTVYFGAGWAGLLLVLHLTTPEGSPLFLALLTLPLAWLAGSLIAGLPFKLADLHLSGAGWWALVASGAVVAVGLAIITDSVGAARAASVPKLILTVGVVIVAGWGWRQAWSSRWVVATLLGGALFALGTFGTIGRLSFGGSPPGSEPFRTEQTDSEFRAAFPKLVILADPGVLLSVNTEPRTAGKWYGRSLKLAPDGVNPGANGIVIRTATGSIGSGPSLERGTRLPWRIQSQIVVEDLNPLGILRWLITRHGLVVGRFDDVSLLRS